MFEYAVELGITFCDFQMIFQIFKCVWASEK